MSFLTRLLQTTGLSLALMTASAAGVHAQTVQGAPGLNGADGVNPGDPGQPGAPGGDAIVNGGPSVTAIGGYGGIGGTDGFDPNDFNPSQGVPGAIGGQGGYAGATATGSQEADANSFGGAGGPGGGIDEAPDQGGNGGFASSVATANAQNGNATATTTAMGGGGGSSDALGGGGGDASASSTAITTGSGAAFSTANATGGGNGGVEFGGSGPVGNATATAYASTTGGREAIATANATAGAQSVFFPFQKPAVVGEAMSTATTSLRGVSVQSTVMAPVLSSGDGSGPTTTTQAIAQGGSAPTFSQAQPFAISTVLTDKTYVTTLIDTFGGASTVSAALLGPQDEIFGTADQFGITFQAGVGNGETTFDFRDPGDLLLGVIGTYGSVDIIVNGAQTFQIGSSVTDAVINLGSNFGPNIDLTINGYGAFVIGGAVPQAVPELSTWAMMLLGFAGLGFAGYRSTRRYAAVGLRA